VKQRGSQVVEIGLAAGSEIPLADRATVSSQILPFKITTM
jgi:hypothetical protein